MIAAIAVTPYLKISKEGSSFNTAINISFSLADSNPETIEQRVTSVIEGACANLGQLKKISSTSRYNSGTVQLLFDRSTDLEIKKVEVNSLIRQIYPHLPPGTSYPTVVAGGNHSTDERRPLLIYNVLATDIAPTTTRQLSDILNKQLSGIKGIDKINISGSSGQQISIVFNKARCYANEIDPAVIIFKLQTSFSGSFPGISKNDDGTQYFLNIPDNNIESLATLEQLTVSLPGAPQVKLKDVATVFFEEIPTSGYFRVNGKSFLTVSVISKPGINRIKLSDTIIEQLTTFKHPQYSLSLAYNDSEFLKKELQKNVQRSAIAVSILLVLLMLSYRTISHICNLLIGLLMSLALTTVVVWTSGIEIHLYTISGLAISFGIIIDNAIVVLDNSYRQRNRKIFPALLCSNLIIICAMSLIALMGYEALTDFSLIISISLGASLLTSLFFTPALLRLFKHVEYKQPFPRKGVKLYLAYVRSVQFIAVRRKTFISLLVLLFGCPLFLLPERWEGHHWYQQLYNSTIGSDLYTYKIRHHTDKYLGGTLYQFHSKVNIENPDIEPEQTSLHLSAKLPFGSTPEQMNALLHEIEVYLSKINSINEYLTTVYSGQTGQIEIFFKNDYETTSLPIRLKEILTDYSRERGGAEWTITGIGQGYSNTSEREQTDFTLVLKGYNYNALKAQVSSLIKKLSGNMRIQHINSNAFADDPEDREQGYVLNTDPRLLSLRRTSQQEMLNELFFISNTKNSIAAINVKEDQYPVVLKEKDAENFSIYDLLHKPLQLNSNKTIRLQDFSEIKFTPLENNIYREARQYIQLVSFEYIGQYQDGQKFLDRQIKDLRNSMPLGYTIEISGEENSQDSDRYYMLLSLIVLTVFILCSILFENLRQPLVIICITPVAFIGPFLLFAFTNKFFDYGGYATLIILGSQIANPAIFIINDLNSLLRTSHQDYNRLLFKAVFKRIRIILLTTAAVCCGFVPIMLEDKQESFWSALSAGCVSGLFFVLVAVIILLPVLLYKPAKIVKHTNI